MAIETEIKRFGSSHFVDIEVIFHTPDSRYKSFRRIGYIERTSCEYTDCFAWQAQVEDGVYMAVMDFAVPAKVKQRYKELRPVIDAMLAE